MAALAHATGNAKAPRERWCVRAGLM